MTRVVLDTNVLECAAEGRADYIVTGDKDLLVLHPFRGISIVKPREFLSVLARMPTGVRH